MDLQSYIRDVPDFPKKGILFKDITTLLLDGEAFAYTIAQFGARYRGSGVNKIVGIEARGFIFAAALAHELGLGMVPIRKVGKLPSRCVRKTYDLEYGTDSVEVHEDALGTADRVIVIDDVIATGGTLGAACELVESLGATIHEVATVIELTFLPGKEKLNNRPFFSLVQF